jgi:predicted MFS family arabinose efflux permease
MAAGVPSPAARTRTISAIVLALGAGLVLAGIGFPNPLLAVGMTAVGLLAGIPAMQRLLPPGTLRAAPGMPATVATMGLLNLAFFGVDAFVPLGLVEVRGTSVTFAGFALTAATVTWTTGSWIQARAASRVSRRAMTRLGLVLLAVSFIVTTATLQPTLPVEVGVVGWGIAGLAMGLAYTTLSLAMLELAPPGQEGDASASLQLTSVLGSGLGAGLGGALIALLQARGEPLSFVLTLQYGLMLVVVALGVAAARGLPRRSQKS